MSSSFNNEAVLIRLLLVLVFSAGFAETFSQREYRGIVADSLSLRNLPDVHVTIKNSPRGVITSNRGTFVIQARPVDTLIFTLLGYKPLVLPLLFEEDVMMVLLGESVQMLANVTVRATRLYPNKVDNHTRSEPRYMNPLGAFASPFDYFWREERDRRKLARYVRENNRTQTYRQVISDPDVQQILMDAYGVGEREYFDLIVSFNIGNPSVHYLTDADDIMERLHDFFARMLTAR